MIHDVNKQIGMRGHQSIFLSLISLLALCANVSATKSGNTSAASA